MPSKPKDLWLVGRTDRKTSSVWVFIGVFDKESLAVAACAGERYFVVPVSLNEVLENSVPRVPWPDAYFPGS